MSDLFLLHPAQLANLMELTWIQAQRSGVNAMGTGNRRRPSELSNLLYDDLRAIPAINLEGISSQYEDVDLPNNQNWDHLIYALMIENTRVVQIFQEVLKEFFIGEKLNVPSPEGQAWIRNTEMLFFRPAPGYYTFSLSSDLRPDAEANRRNIYYRMFGMDCIHGTSENKKYSFDKPESANKNFNSTFERFLAEAHRAIINQQNSAGVNTSDLASVADLAGNLANMLQVRRENGNLSREEFFMVSMMSWFHLTLELPDTPILHDLNARGNSPEDRLKQVGEKTGLYAHSKSGSFFSLADNLSDLFLAIEEDQFSEPDNVELNLLGPTYIGPLREIITHWSIASGKNIRAMK